LAQIGEFSFILATLGMTLGVLPPTARDLILAGAIFSIILNPFVFIGLDRLKSTNGKPKESITDNAAKCAKQTGHTILVGYGELGKWVGDELTALHHPFILVENHPDMIHVPHDPDIPAVYGYASAPGVLSEAKIEQARCMILTISDAIVAGQLIDYARQLNPAIITIARANSDAEGEHLKAHGATHVIISKREVAKNLVKLVV
jgi:CPA2 family monovalent cation:H+ antiporter-2